MNEFLKNYNDTYEKKVDEFISKSNTIENIYQQVLKERNIDLKQYEKIEVERNTKKGYKLSFHKDHYMIRKFKTKYKFIQFDKDPPVLYTLIWYKEVECSGAEFVFYPNKIIKPERNMFIFFDSNQLHKVNLQRDGTRKIIIYKFY